MAVLFTFRQLLAICVSVLLCIAFSCLLLPTPVISAAASLREVQPHSAAYSEMMSGENTPDYDEMSHSEVMDDEDFDDEKSFPIDEEDEEVGSFVETPISKEKKNLLSYQKIAKTALGQMKKICPKMEDGAHKGDCETLISDLKHIDERKLFE